MKKNKKALSLVIAISITLVMALLALYILEYMIPFSKNTKNIEQSVSAYYKADSAIEDALYSMKQNSGTLDYEKHKTMPSSASGYSISMTSSGQILPPVGEGNSEFDKNYNIISQANPIQIQIGKGSINPDTFKLYLKIPDLDKNDTENLKTTPDKLIHWQISGNGNTLNASGSQIVVGEINNSAILLKDKNGRDLNDNSNTFGNFYNSNCGIGTGCILKLSVINELVLDNGEKVPYLEWKIDASPKTIPLRYRIIKTKGKSYGFEKSLRIRVPQKTLNQAYDFTVFQ